jgi:hypothetical protein
VTPSTADLKATVEAIAHAFDVAALRLGADHPLAEALSSTMAVAARLAVEAAEVEERLSE